MNSALEKLLLSELRIVVYEPGPAPGSPEHAPAPGSAEASSAQKPLLDKQITKAMTVNEELRNLGYTLKPGDILALAASRSVDGFAEHFRSLLPKVDAPPMYPDFPSQVMEMEEAEFRLHQMIHYFSTYGLEDLFGVKIGRGWLPDVEATPKSEKDDKLLSAKVLELVPEKDAPLTAVRRILARRERMSRPAGKIVALAVPLLRPEELAGIPIPFKENLVLLFDAVLEGTDGPGAARPAGEHCAGRHEVRERNSGKKQISSAHRAKESGRKAPGVVSGGRFQSQPDPVAGGKREEPDLPEVPGLQSVFAKRSAQRSSAGAPKR